MHEPAQTPVLLWFRTDLRLADHAALHAALQTGTPILPIYILDDETPGPWSLGGAARWWLHHSLTSLTKDLAARGAPLVLRRGPASNEIPRLAAETGATAVYAGCSHEPWARRLDEALVQTLQHQRVQFRRYRTTTIFPPDAVRTGAGGPFSVFTPFSRACLTLGPPPLLPAPTRIPSIEPPRSDRLEDWRLLPTRPDWAGGLRDTWTPGESAAQHRLHAFLATAAKRYADTRDRPAIDGTSMLSPHLHWGELSAAQAWHAAAMQDGPGAESFIRELLWREFSYHLLWHRPAMPDQPLRDEFAAMPWRQDDQALAAWQRGRTGIPIVDAGMRQLWHIGWMHNRVRMIVASFLTKHLLLPWQDGAAWFWDTLVDANLASNSQNWQWVAGSGADAAPYFRIFNPVLQGKKFDPDGGYVRRWVPELAPLGAAHIHAPWEAPHSALSAAGLTLGTTYPLPLIDLATGRARALAAFQSLPRSA